jgi:hypothetical protein
MISETPLSLVAGIRVRPGRMVMVLANGGALLDFRTKDGATPLHRYMGCTVYFVVMISKL